MDIEQLMRPFEGSQIRQRMGPGRRPLDYISGPDVIRRLLDATENRFSWTVDKVQLITQDTASGPVAFWVVHGALSLGDRGLRYGVGTHPADGVEAAKAAETDAFKRAAVKFGVGLHLYEEDSGNGGTSGPPPSPPRRHEEYAMRPDNGSAASGARRSTANNGNGNRNVARPVSPPPREEDDPFA